MVVMENKIWKKMFLNYKAVAILFFACFLFFSSVHEASATTYVNDTFTDTTGTLLQNHTADGNTWVKNNAIYWGDVTISSAGRIYLLSSMDIYDSSFSPPTYNYTVSADVYLADGVVSGNTGIGGRCGASTLGYFATVSPGPMIKLYSTIGTQIGAYSLSGLAAGQTHAMKLVMNGNNIKVYWDASSVIDVTATGGNIIGSIGVPCMYFDQPATATTQVHIDNFLVTDNNPLVAGVLSSVSQTSTSATVSWTSGSGGTAPITAQLQRSAHSANTWSNVSGATTSPATDTGLSPSTSYDYKVVYTDTASSTATSNILTVTADNSLSAGVLSSVSQTSTSATVSWTVASGGTAPITAQLQRSAHSANTWSNVSGATTSPVTDTGLSPSTSYDYKVVYTDATSSTATSNILTIVTNDITYNVQQADLWDNGYDNVNAPKQSTFARFVFTTNAASITVTGNSTLYPNYYATLGVQINGVDQSPLSFTSASQSFTVNLGSAGTTRTVDIITGMQSDGGTNTVSGSFINSITYPATASFNVLPPNDTPNRVLVYGDSISAGAYATNPESQAYVPLLRNLYGQSVMLEGWGYRALYDDAHTVGLLNAFVSRLVSYTPSTIYLAIGTNDWGDSWNVNSFGTAYGNLLDGLHSALPAARVICQTPLVRGSEITGPLNSNGNTLADYRSQIATVCNARSSYAALVDGTTLLTLSDVSNDVHPTDSGFVKYAKRIAPILAQPSYTVSGPSSGSASQTSTAFTVTLGNSAPFIGDQTITISDGGDGGTFTPSVGSSGISSVTVTPAASANSFTFTYTPASSGSKTFTLTNGQSGWSNPSNISYFSLSSNDTVSSSTYTVSSLVGNAGTIINVPYNTSKATFESNLTKGQINQTWTDTGIHDPILTGDTLVVLAQDGVSQATYTITVTPASADATLSNLAISAGTLSPTFSSETTSYTESVDYNTNNLTVTPTRNQASATMTISINNSTPIAITSGLPSDSLPLNVGSNTITVVVTAQDSSTNTYTITVTRAPGGGGLTYYPISVYVTPNGSITPQSQSIARGGSYTFTITPYTGYQIADVLVDNISVGARSTYTFSNVTQSHTILANFSAISVTTPPVSPINIPPNNTPTIESLKAQILQLQILIQQILAQRGQNPTTPQLLTKDLRFGSYDSEVILLQNILKKLNLFSQSINSTKSFGPTTLKSVKAFQLKYNILTAKSLQYGMVGSNTRNKLNELNK